MSNLNIMIPNQLKEDTLTVGQLLDFISSNNISRDALVFSQRTFDTYFEKLNWPIVEQEGDKSQSDKGIKEQYTPIDALITIDNNLYLGYS